MKFRFQLYFIRSKYIDDASVSYAKLFILTKKIRYISNILHLDIGVSWMIYFGFLHTTVEW